MYSEIIYQLTEKNEIVNESGNIKDLLVLSKIRNLDICISF